MRNLIKYLVIGTALIFGSALMLFAQAPPGPPVNPVGTIPWGNPGIYGIVLMAYMLFQTFRKGGK
ncbi:hypothetical protein ACFL7D_00800 [candidate division KSB1 bacterium]